MGILWVYRFKIVSSAVVNHPAISSGLQISGRVDRASATEVVDMGSIPGRVKPKTIKNW